MEGEFAAGILKAADRRRANGPLIVDGVLRGIVSTGRIVKDEFVVDATDRCQLLTRCVNLSWPQHWPARFACFGFTKERRSVSLDVPRLHLPCEPRTWVGRVREHLDQ